MPETTTTELVEFTNAGLLIVQIDEETFTLRRPKIGVLRALDEAWTAIGDLQREKAEAEEPEPFDFAPMFIAWYRQMFVALADKPLPENDDDLPSWFVGAEAGNEIRPKWKSVPWAAGAKPSEQAQSATLNQLAQMGDVLKRIESAIPALISANGTH